MRGKILLGAMEASKLAGAMEACESDSCGDFEALLGKVQNAFDPGLFTTTGVNSTSGQREQGKS